MKDKYILKDLRSSHQKPSFYLIYVCSNKNHDIFKGYFMKLCFYEFLNI